MQLFIFSQLVGRPLLDTRQEKVATLKDIIVRVNPQAGTAEETYPRLSALLAHTAGRNIWIPASQVASFEERAIRLASSDLNLQRFVRRDGEILLGQDVLDKQLVDVEGRRVVRVNDLALGRVPGEQELRLLAVDISFRALWRRLLFSLSGEYPRAREPLLDWAHVQYFGSLVPAVRLHISHDRLGKLHPADLARILEDLSHQQRDEVVRSLGDEVVADTLEYLSSNEAADILEEVPEGRASDILEEMRPDMAADVVVDLDAEKAEQLLQLMEPEESEEVRDLLAYPKESAGGMMTNEFVMLPSQLPAADALRVIRAMEETPEFVDYLYVAEVGTQRVRGVVSLLDVVFCPDRTTPLERLMRQDLVSVHPQTPAEEAAALLTTYGLRALPVIDDLGELQGIITFDDALDVLLPEQLRERIGHLFTYRRGRRAQEHMNTKNA